MGSLHGQSRRERILTIGLAAMVVAAISYFTRRGIDQESECCARDVPALGTRLAVDPAVRADTLANGLRYFLRQNANPAGIAELRLVVAAGSVHEDEDQRGLAHAVEHMAFRGTTNFPGSRITDYLQSLGMRSGYDVNATTSFDETVYRLTIPTDSAPVLDTAIAILADWAHAITFDSIAARTEAGVVFEEWRSGTDVGARIARELDGLLLRGSRYPDRFPIGDTAVLRKFDVQAMRRFYRDWYRPDLMTVVAVGDFDADAMEDLLRRRFGDIAASTSARSKPAVNEPREKDPRALVLFDAEASGTRVAFWFPREHGAIRTVGDYRRSLLDDLVHDLLDARLEDASERANSPLLSANASVSALARTIEALTIGGLVVDGEVPGAVSALAEEIARLQRFGPSAGELERAKTAMVDDRRDLDTYGRFSDDVADDLVWHALHCDDALAPGDEYQMTRGLLSAIAVSDIVTAAQRLSLDSGFVVVVTTSDDARTAMTASSLVASARAGATRATEIPRDTALATRLVTVVPTAGTIVSERVLRDIDAFEWTLGNGMRVIVKPTDWSDELVLRLTAPGGASLATRAAFPSAYMADRVLEATGVGPLNGARLARMLDQTSIELSPIVTNDWVQLDGSASPRDMSTLFELVHLYFTASRADTVAFRRYRERSRANARHRETDPESVFEDSVSVALRPGDVGALSGSRAFTDAVNLEAAVRFWRERVASASNFTAVLVGDFSLEGIRPLVTRYLASLPAGRAERSVDTVQHLPAGAEERTFGRGVEPRSHTRIVFSGRTTLTPSADATLAVLRDLLEMVLEARLRETMGGTYGVGVDLSVQPTQDAIYRFGIEFSAAPDRVDSLSVEAIRELERLCRHGPTADEASKVKAAAFRDLEAAAESNASWASELSWHAHLGWPLESVDAHREVVEGLDILTLQGACREFIDPRRYVRVTRHPVASARQSKGVH
jgi:zinc protease